MDKLNKNEQEQILNDCLYASLYKRLAGKADRMEQLTKAGYVYEPRTDVDNRILRDASHLSMPIKSMARNAKPSAILISTGSYSPIHEGHIGILNVARRYVESLGYQVVQGVMSASHDAYVSIKRGGEAKRHASIRSQLIFEAIDDSDWLTLDRMEGEMLSCAVNFSTVLQRVRTYMIHHHAAVDESTPVFYVYGSDNGAFSEAFVGNAPYNGICVSRNGDSMDALRGQYAEENNLHFVTHEEAYSNQSSSKIRAAMQAAVGEDEKDPGVYLIRTDGVPDQFAKALAKLIASNITPGIDVQLVDKTDFSIDYEGTLSLDKFVKGRYAIDTSRAFEICSGQISAKAMTSLSAPIEVQVARLPMGEYTLVDDDSITGFTLNSIEQELVKTGSKVVARKTLIEQVLKGRKLYDIVDARDFLIGSDHGGLVVQAGGMTFRAPYLFPFVNLISRAKILADRQHAFSRAVYRLNMQFAVNAEITYSTRAFLAYAGGHSEIASLCREQIAVIDNFLTAYGEKNAEGHTLW